MTSQAQVIGHTPSQPTSTVHRPMHHPCTDTMHGPACPSTKTQIRPHLTYRHQDYMIMLLSFLAMAFIACFFYQIRFCKKFFVSLLAIAQTLLSDKLASPAKRITNKYVAWCSGQHTWLPSWRTQVKISSFSFFFFLFLLSFSS